MLGALVLYHHLLLKRKKNKNRTRQLLLPTTHQHLLPYSGALLTTGAFPAASAASSARFSFPGPQQPTTHPRLACLWIANNPPAEKETPFLPTRVLCQLSSPRSIGTRVIVAANYRICRLCSSTRVVTHWPPVHLRCLPHQRTMMPCSLLLSSPWISSEPSPRPTSSPPFH